MKVLFVASEVAPYAKSGGLADVAGSLPAALEQLGLDVRVMLPRYSRVQRAVSLQVPVLGWSRQVDAYPVGSGDSRTLFLGSPALFEREELYGYPDDGERFIVFCRGVLECARALDFRPDVIHCNDWQTGLIPVYLKTLLRDDPFYARTATLFTIHNLAYQGKFGPDVMALAGLSQDLFHMHALEFHHMVNFLKGGLVFADKLNTVSRAYAQEIQTPDFGEGLDGVLRGRADDLHGVVNGIDQDVWNPAIDPALAVRYSMDSPDGRVACVQALREECGFDAPDAPVLGAVTRLTHEKGIGLLADAAGGIIEAGANIVVLGTGDPYFMGRLSDLERKYPGKMRVFLQFSEDLAHRIYAGSHFLVMPSLYEPCGLSQLIALRYGCVPIARATGGLKDTIVDVDAHNDGTGFLFGAPRYEDLLECVKRALRTFGERERMRALQLRGMSYDSSWRKSAEHYVRLYESALASVR